MMRCRVLLVPLILAGLVTPAPAGPIDFNLFARKPKANPAVRVPELLILLKTSRDESQRAAAAEELREYDPKAFPEITTVLLDALARDAGTSVRAEAASSLGKLRPISQKVGYALEQAVSNDGSLRVRLAARQSLWQYNLVGYRSGRMPAPATDASLVTAPPGPSTPAMTGQRSLTLGQTGLVANGIFRETAEPPLADPPATIVDSGPRTVPAVPVSRPQSGPATPFQLIPTSPPQLTPVPTQPAAKPTGDGPVLPPPG